MSDGGDVRRRSEAEAAIADALSRGAPREALDVLTRAYGPEVYAWLVAVHGRADAGDVYGALLLRLVRSMTTFRGESSARTWLYRIAQNLVREHQREARRRRAVLTPIEGHPRALERPLSSRSSGGRAARLERLRARLTKPERALLVLRVDRGLSYDDIVGILSPEACGPARAREAARLRQQVSAVGRRLRRLAEEDP